MSQTDALKVIKNGKIGRYSGKFGAFFGRLPVIVLPLNDYEKMREDLEMFQSKNLAKEIKKAREEARRGDILDLAKAKKKLRLS